MAFSTLMALHWATSPLSASITTLSPPKETLHPLSSYSLFLLAVTNQLSVSMDLPIQELSLYVSLHLKNLFIILLLFLSHDAQELVCFSGPPAMPAALEEFRGCNAGSQYVKWQKGGGPQDRN